MERQSKRETEVIAFLVHSDTENLKRYIQKLSNVKWAKFNQELFDLCNQYTKLQNPKFSCSEYISNEAEDKNYVLSLLDEDIFIESLAEKNMDDLIKYQEGEEIKKTLEGLKNKPVNEVLSEVKKIKGVRNVEPRSLTNIMSERLNDRSLESIAPSTGYKGLDSIIKGFVPGHTITMTGDTNVGKTQASCNFAYNVARQGKKVLYFSLEPDVTIIEYLASIWSRKRFDSITEEDLIPPKDLKIDVYTKDQISTLDDMVNIVDNSERYDLVIVDHFGYFTSDGNNKTQTESNAMKAIAGLSKRMKTCVLLIVHPRKAGNGRKRKQLSIHDLSGSAALSQDATDVMILSRQKDENDPAEVKYIGDGYMVVHKTKSGPNGCTPIRFVDGSALILDSDEYAKEQAKLF